MRITLRLCLLLAALAVLLAAPAAQAQEFGTVFPAGSCLWIQWGVSNGQPYVTIAGIQGVLALLYLSAAQPQKSFDLPGYPCGISGRLIYQPKTDHSRGMLIIESTITQKGLGRQPLQYNKTLGSW